MAHIKIRTDIILCQQHYEAIKGTRGPFDRWLVFIRGQIHTFILFHFHTQPACTHAKSLSGWPGVKTLLKSLFCSQILSVKTNLYLGQDFGATVSFTLHFIVSFALSSLRLSISPSLSSSHPRTQEDMLTSSVQSKREEYYG